MQQHLNGRGVRWVSTSFNEFQWVWSQLIKMAPTNSGDCQVGLVVRFTASRTKAHRLKADSTRCHVGSRCQFYLNLQLEPEWKTNRHNQSAYLTLPIDELPKYEFISIDSISKYDRAPTSHRILIDERIFGFQVPQKIPHCCQESSSFIYDKRQVSWKIKCLKAWQMIPNNHDKIKKIVKRKSSTRIVKSILISELDNANTKTWSLELSRIKETKANSKKSLWRVRKIFGNPRRCFL